MCVSHYPGCLTRWTVFENSAVPHKAGKLGVYNAKAAAWQMWACAALSDLKGLKVLELSTLQPCSSWGCCYGMWPGRGSLPSRPQVLLEGTLEKLL